MVCINYLSKLCEDVVGLYEGVVGFNRLSDRQAPHGSPPKDT